MLLSSLLKKERCGFQGSKLLLRYGRFLEVIRDGRRSGGRQPALRRPGAFRRRTTGSPTADSFVSHSQYLLRDRIFLSRQREYILDRPVNRLAGAPKH